MEVYVTVAKGEDLKLGIRTGNRRNDGTTATDNAGWFKVDNFRIEKVSGMPEPQEDDKTGRMRSRILSMNKEAARFFHACLNSTAR